jgi:sulfur-carrier protein adenylyltransferase/sulfurtransferase
MATANGCGAMPSSRASEPVPRVLEDRYARQSILPEIGAAGQERLRVARLLCVGAGGLGCASLPYLAGAGIGRITIVDPDRVDRTNLHRQVLYGERDVGRPKALAAAARLRDLNGDIDVVGIEAAVDPSNVEALLREHDLAIDGTDSYAAKYLLADTTALLRMPLVYGSVTGMEAMVSVFDVRRGPCLRCLFPQPPEVPVPTCAQAGVLGPLVGMAGAMQAAEAIKTLIADGEAGAGGDGLRPLIGRLWHIDARDMRSRQVAVARRPGCAGCAGTAEPVPTSRRCAAVPAVDAEIAATFAGAVFVDVRDAHEFDEGHIPGAVNRPLSVLHSSPPELPEAPHYVVYCSHGVRSVAASELLVASGVRGVRHLEGGLARWRGPMTVGRSLAPKEGFAGATRTAS